MRSGRRRAAAPCGRRKATDGGRRRHVAGEKQQTDGGGSMAAGEKQQREGGGAMVAGEKQQREDGGAMAAGEKRQTEGGGSMAGNGGRTRGKGFVRLTRAGRRSTPRSNTRRPSWRNTPFPGSPVTVPLNIRRHPPSFNASPHLRPNIPFFRAETIPFQPPPAQYPYYTGRNSILPATSGPISLLYGPEQHSANQLRPPKELYPGRRKYN